MHNKRILLDHGSGGRLSRELLDTLFCRHLGNPVLNMHTDAALLASLSGRPALTTDSYVITPHVFPGGDIGKLAVCGTVNDLAVSGAVPIALTAGFIIEEGCAIALLERIVESMARAAREAAVIVAAGDTKVVEKGMCDRVFINTAGLGDLPDSRAPIGSGARAGPGDVVIVSGTIGDHGMAVMAARNDIPVQADMKSDCAPLNGMIQDLLSAAPGVTFMRDATRGGLGTVLCELADMTSAGVEFDESATPVNDSVVHMCDLFGFDPLFVANEGKIVIAVKAPQAEAACAALRSHRYGAHAAIIGTLVADHPRQVHMRTSIGGTRIIDVPAGAQLPRIC